MTKTVWHYGYHHHGGHPTCPWELALPRDAQPLGVHYENGVLGVWVVLDPAEMANQIWVIEVVRMGEEFDAPAESTIHYLGGPEDAGPDTPHYFAFRKGEI